MRKLRVCRLVLPLLAILPALPSGATGRGYFEVVLEAHREYEHQQWARSVGLYRRAFSLQNQDRVVAIIDEFGWPGKSLVGPQGSQTAFLVIQHAPLEIQERYLPVMRTAVAELELEPADLALLEDRILARRDLPQVYGSQVQCDPKTWDNCYLLPVEDEANVNALRASVGLEPLEAYLEQWQIEWSPPEASGQPATDAPASSP